MYHSPTPIGGGELDAQGPHAASVRAPSKSRSKRALDIVCSLASLVFFAPLLLAMAVLIRIESPGPALFRQKRGGLNGQAFVIYKFRTMRVHEEGAGVLHCRRDDERVTRLGSFLRRTSLDELPQLLNVLRGDMSLVGPRPHALAHDELYGALVPEYGARAAARPGLTGPAQISGLRGDIINLDMMRRRVDCDVEYIRTWSFTRDVRLIVATASRVLVDSSAY